MGGANGEEEEHEGERCSVCLESPLTHALVPFGHRVCGGCAPRLQACPQCRKSIKMAMKLY